MKKTEPRYRTHNMCEVQALVSSVRLMTSQQSEQVHVSRTLRHVLKRCLATRTFLILTNSNCTVSSDRNCSLRYAVCSQRICVLLDVQP